MHHATTAIATGHNVRNSGGPWYYGHLTQGLHFGKIGAVSTYTPIIRYEDFGYTAYR
ncbi:hypothetical protein K0651_05270 [Ornithinimicrobium sp. Arc0846-15]|nr:hypothetical protein [Ornithinimicrobium laminariae]